MCEPKISYELMMQNLRHVFTDATVKSLFGSGPRRALSAYQKLLANGTCPSLYLEFPLLGPASYDVFVGPYADGLRPGTHLPKTNPPACHAAWEWASAQNGGPGFDLLFELDSAGPKARHAGIHFRHMGNLDAAENFYRAIGEDRRAALYRNVAQRLPKGWIPAFAAVFAGRPGAPTRLEAFPSPDDRLRIAKDPGFLGSCLEHIGFGAYNDHMLKEISTIIALDRPVSLQFDILADGTPGSTLSVASFVEKTGSDFHSLFKPGGIIARICDIYERMGVCDDRWRRVEEALFAKKDIRDINHEQRWVTMVSTPICCKAKWIDATPRPSKFYLVQRNAVGERWSLCRWLLRPQPGAPGA